MSQIRIAYIKDVELRGGEKRKAGEVVIATQLEAEKAIQDGNAVCYSDFKSSMLSGVDAPAEPGRKGGRQSRVLKNPEGVDAPAEPAEEN